MTEQCKRRGYAAPVDVLMDIGVLDKKKYEDWRFGRVDYLERVCNTNLHKLSEIMKTIRICAKDLDLKPSYSDYQQWGAKNHKLRFSKSKDPNIEKHYAKGLESEVIILACDSEFPVKAVKHAVFDGNREYLHYCISYKSSYGTDVILE